MTALPWVMSILALALAAARGWRISRMNIQLGVLEAFVRRALDQRQFPRIGKLAGAIDETAIGPALAAANRVGSERAKDAEASDERIAEAMRDAFDEAFARAFTPVTRTRWLALCSLFAAAAAIGLEASSDAPSKGPVIVSGCAFVLLALTVRGVQGVRKGADFLAPILDAYVKALRAPS